MCWQRRHENQGSKGRTRRAVREVRSTLPIYRTNYLRIDTDSWFIEPDDVSLILLPPDGQAELRIRTYDYGINRPWKELAADCRTRAPNDARVVEVYCGEYGGFTYEYVDEERTYWREWILGLAEMVLLVTYTCD